MKSSRSALVAEDHFTHTSHNTRSNKSKTLHISPMNYKLIMTQQQPTPTKTSPTTPIAIAITTPSTSTKQTLTPSPTPNASTSPTPNIPTHPSLPPISTTSQPQLQNNNTYTTPHSAEDQKRIWYHDSLQIGTKHVQDEWGFHSTAGSRACTPEPGVREGQ
ncbi:hypothetical protein CC86DRAFT_78127 [Ophiobolus disseminans]|uniref:Uncharacterized protein n=1 Tax=Ophiobolus disseminans TaxID=1469910 RepID=A0A6A6ZPP1_9PLEO|nr:hypothetical protein CC86DRAFT_78127 [Ophiobolus disseminans]